MFNKQEFVEDVVRSFKKARPEWTPPHKTIFSTAKNHGASAKINGKDETWWLANLDTLFEEQDDRLDYPKVRVANITLVFDWQDCRLVALKANKKKRGS